MNFVTGLLSAVSPLADGDFVDRMNYCYTTTLLVVCSVFVSGWSFIGQPIGCWFPAYYRGWWAEYALDLCFVQNTYWLKMVDVPQDNQFDFASHIVPIPQNVTERDEKQLGYYQWVPFILALQAMMFYLPVVLWRFSYSAIGCKVKVICDTCSIKGNMESNERSKNMDIVARFIVHDQNVHNHFNSTWKQRLEGKILSKSYLLIKLIYLLNACFQFSIVKWMLGTDSMFWGLQVARDLYNGQDWPETGNFPRVTMCDFEVRVLGNLHRHSVQCVLMINMFNEKIFVLLWFWFAAVAAFSTISFFSWLIASIDERGGYALISSYMIKINPSIAKSPSKKQLLRKFIKNTLKSDGVFLLRLVSYNSGDLVTCQLLSSLWTDFIKTTNDSTNEDEKSLLRSSGVTSPFNESSNN
uniref:Innexin n=1 Tax=Rhabditophanes sp. KR3021 TaxID=114890 RepID=A0AC35UDP8_9BILA